MYIILISQKQVKWSKRKNLEVKHKANWSKFLDNYFTHLLADFAHSLKLKKHEVNSFLYNLLFVHSEPNFTGRKKLKRINKTLKNFVKLF